MTILLSLTADVIKLHGGVPLWWPQGPSASGPLAAHVGAIPEAVAACPCLPVPVSAPSPQVSLLSPHCQQPARLRRDLGTEQPSSCGNASFNSFSKYGHIVLVKSPPKLQLGFQECEFPLCLPDDAAWRGGRDAGMLQRACHGGTGLIHLMGHPWGQGLGATGTEPNPREQAPTEGYRISTGSKIAVSHTSPTSSAQTP